MTDWTAAPEPYQPTAGTGVFRSAQALGVAAMIGIGVVMILDVVTMLETVHLSGLVDDYVAGTADLAALNRADRRAAVISLFYVLALIAAGIPFICWMWRARRNAEFFTDAKHRHGIGWVVGGWFCPVVNLWFPCQIASDIQAASDWRTPATGGWLQRPGANKGIIGWWLTLLASSLLGLSANGQVSAATTPEQLRSALSMSILSSMIHLVAGFLAIRLIMTINNLQLTRPPIPWSATTQPPWQQNPPTSQPHHPASPWPGNPSQDPPWPKLSSPGERSTGSWPQAPAVPGPQEPAASETQEPRSPWPQQPAPQSPSQEPPWPKLPPSPGEQGAGSRPQDPEPFGQ